MDSTSTTPNPNPSTLIFNNFEVTLLYSGAQLSITAVEIPTSKHFELIILPEQVKELTSYIFPDLEFLYLGLLDAFEHQDPLISAAISEDAKLSYLWERLVRGQKRVEKFTLALREGTIPKDEQEKRHERQVERLLRKIADQELRIQALEEENSRLKTNSEKDLIERFETLNKGMISEVKETLLRRVEDLEKNLERDLKSVQVEGYLGESYKFDPSCANAEHFFFENGNETITHRSCSDWKAIFARNAIRSTHKRTFCIKIDSTSSGSIMIGICPNHLKNQPIIYNTPGVYCYFGYGEGFVFTNGTRSHLSKSGLKTGSTMTVIVDLISNTVYFELNGVLVYNTNVIGYSEYYPFVEFYDQNDKVSFV